jgi:hypothetical protein
LPGFQLERLKRRREIQAKLEGVVEEMSQEQRDVLDPKLFVGDRGGLKKLETDSRRMVSRPDRQLVFMSGFRGKEVELGEGGSKRAEIKEMEVRELETSNDTDDPDMSEAVALSLVDEGEPTQEDILEIIRKNGGSASTSKKSKQEVDTFVIDDASDEEIVFIPTASLFSSNRLGGKSIIKEEVEDVKEVVQIMSDNDNSSDGVGVMSGSVSDSEMSEEDKTVADDMFADIVIDTINVTELDAIILKAKEDASKPSTTTPVKTNSLANELLERVSKLDMVVDLIAGISKKVMKEVQPAEDRSSKPSKDAPSTSSSNSVDRAEFTKEISNNLKNGPGIMMKIASRWAEADLVKSSPKKTEKDGEKDSGVKSFESEQSSLLKEMAEV